MGTGGEMLRAGNRITPKIDRCSVPFGSVAGTFTHYRRRNAMRLANRVLLCALAIFIFSALSFGQTPRPNNDPRNQSPSVGTGGPEGGATGLFTIYDGSTLRKGEFTFSVAYSNYDRDPGNVDITDTIASVNIGLNDHIELFFKTQAYRGIKVNNPQNLCSCNQSSGRLLQCWSAIRGVPVHGRPRSKLWNGARRHRRTLRFSRFQWGPRPADD